MPKRSKPKPTKNTIEIEKNRSIGDLPVYIGLGHRHLEKEMPASGYQASLIQGDKVKESGRYTIPVDLASMVLPPEYSENIASIELEYERVL